MQKSLNVIIVLLLLGVGVMGVLYFATQNRGGFNFTTNDQAETEETITDTSDSQLDEDLAEIKLEDPSVDFSLVDPDISSL